MVREIERRGHGSDSSTALRSEVSTTPVTRSFLGNSRSTASGPSARSGSDAEVTRLRGVVIQDGRSTCCWRRRVTRSCEGSPGRRYLDWLADMASSSLNSS